MRLLELVFWAAASLIAYTYVGYGVVITALARVRPRPHRRDAEVHPRVDLIIAAFNEESVIRQKIRNSLAQTYPSQQLDIVVVSDGSTDRTAAIVEEFANRGVLSLHQPERAGKAAAVNRAVNLTDGDVLVFS